MVCATSEGSDYPAHTRSLIRAFASRLNISMNLSLPTDHHSGLAGCIGSSESTHVKMPHFWHARIQKVCQRGANFDKGFFERGETIQANTTISGPSSARQRIAIRRFTGVPIMAQN